ncbi:hypothetical protein DITRI_Ditri17bG0097800 [Diplodiscus trichospermus]
MIMKSIFGPFILRRLKSEMVQQLVPKIQRVEYVIMEKQEEDAYGEAVEEYCKNSRACIAKLSESDLHNIVGILPQRQNSNYFIQFRKAEDCHHLIGQTRPVTIYRLVMKGAVDENVYEIAKRKLTLDAAVLESGIDIDNERDAFEKTMGQILSSLLMS